MIDCANQIKSAVSMADICRMYGVEVNHAGFARCPFHEERTSSFRVYPGDKGWHCFGACGEGGSVIDFVMKFFGLSFADAIRKINADFGLNLPIDAEPSEEERKEAARVAYERRQKLARQKKARQDAIERYYGALSDWVDADTTAQESAPKTFLEPISDIYASALKAKDKAAYRLDLAEDELYFVEKRE